MATSASASSTPWTVTEELEDSVGYGEHAYDQLSVTLDSITLKFSDPSWEKLFTWQSGFYLIKNFDVVALLIVCCLTTTRLLLNAQDQQWVLYNSALLIMLLVQAATLFCPRAERMAKARSVVVGIARPCLLALTARLFAIATANPTLTCNVKALLLWTSLPHAWAQLCMPVPFKYNICLVPVEFAIYWWAANGYICNSVVQSQLYSTQIQAIWSQVNNWSNVAVVHLQPHAGWLPPVEVADQEFTCQLLLCMWQLLTGSTIPLAVVYLLEKSARKQFAMQSHLQGVLMASLDDGLHSTLSQILTTIVFVLLTMVAAWQVLLTIAVFRA